MYDVKDARTRKILKTFVDIYQAGDYQAELSKNGISTVVRQSRVTEYTAPSHK